jgi:hypothetical protein
MRAPLTLACSFLIACGGGTTVPGSDASTADGGGDAGTGSDSGNVDPNKLGTPCQSGACPSGLEPVTYCGFTGCNGDAGQMCSCEIKCDQDAGACPPGSACAFVSYELTSAVAAGFRWI